jgi:hypothetical protein
LEKRDAGEQQGENRHRVENFKSIRHCFVCCGSGKAGGLPIVLP